jgi:hypothetical protein
MTVSEGKAETSPFEAPCAVTLLSAKQSQRTLEVTASASSKVDKSVCGVYDRTRYC